RWRRRRRQLVQTREQNDGDSQARETLVTFPTTHDATPLRDGEMIGPRERRRGADRLLTARSGSTGRRLDTGADPLLMSNGKVGRRGDSSRDLRLLCDSCGHPELSRRDADEALEVMTEHALAREARVRGDLRQGEVAALQEQLGALDAAHDD